MVQFAMNSDHFNFFRGGRGGSSIGYISNIMTFQLFGHRDSLIFISELDKLDLPLIFTGGANKFF